MSETVESGSRTGNLYLNPVMTERATVPVSAGESNGKLVRAELWMPTGGRVAALPGDCQLIAALRVWWAKTRMCKAARRCGRTLPPQAEIRLPRTADT